MIIKFNGTQNLFNFVKNLHEILDDIQERAGLEEQPFKLRDVQVGIVFGEEGNEQYLTVSHDDIPEVFQVQVQLNEAGQIDIQKDNQEETFMDDYSRALAKGEESHLVDEIQSVFEDSELEEIDRIACGDIEEVIYSSVDGLEVHRYYRNNVLVVESAIKPQNKN